MLLAGIILTTCITTGEKFSLNFDKQFTQNKKLFWGKFDNITKVVAFFHYGLKFSRTMKFFTITRKFDIGYVDYFPFYFVLSTFNSHTFIFTIAKRPILNSLISFLKQFHQYYFPSDFTKYHCWCFWLCNIYFYHIVKVWCKNFRPIQWIGLLIMVASSITWYIE